MDTKVTGWIDQIITNGIGWINKGFEFFGVYTSKYSKGILILIGIFLLSKMVDLKAVFGGGGKK